MSSVADLLTRRLTLMTAGSTNNSYKCTTSNTTVPRRVVKRSLQRWPMDYNTHINKLLASFLVVLGLHETSLVLGRGTYHAGYIRINSPMFDQRSNDVRLALPDRVVQWRVAILRRSNMVTLCSGALPSVLMKPMLVGLQRQTQGHISSEIRHISRVSAEQDLPHQYSCRP